MSTRDDGNGDIFVMNADGSDRKRLTTYTGSDLEPMFSPDGGKIAFTSFRGMRCKYYFRIGQRRLIS